MQVGNENLFLKMNTHMRHNEHQESISLLPGGGEIGGEMLFVMVKHYLLHKNLLGITRTESC